MTAQERVDLVYRYWNELPGRVSDEAPMRACLLEQIESAVAEDRNRLLAAMGGDKVSSMAVEIGRYFLMQHSITHDMIRLCARYMEAAVAEERERCAKAVQAGALSSAGQCFYCRGGEPHIDGCPVLEGIRAIEIPVYKTIAERTGYAESRPGL